MQKIENNRSILELLNKWSSPLGTLAVIVAVVLWAHTLYRDTQQLKVDFATFNAVTSQRLGTIETEQSAQGKAIANMVGKLDLLIDRDRKK